jgi:hypothetical protein
MALTPAFLARTSGEYVPDEPLLATTVFPELVFGAVPLSVTVPTPVFVSTYAPLLRPADSGNGEVVGNRAAQRVAEVKLPAVGDADC